MAEPNNNEADRVNLVYTTTIGGVEQEIELPFRLLVCGDFTRNEESEYFDGQVIHSITDKNLQPLYLKLRPSVSLQVENKLLKDDSSIVLDYSFSSIEDFSPERIMARTEVFSCATELHLESGETDKR